MRAELESVNAELKAAEEDEARVKQSIDERQGMRFRYNIYQIRAREKELEPFQRELFTVQQRISGLNQRKARIEGELRSSE